MTLLKFTLAPAALALAVFGAAPERAADVSTFLVNKTDLEVAITDGGGEEEAWTLIDRVNAEGKGDCDCAGGTDRDSARAIGFHNGFGGDTSAAIIMAAADPGKEEVPDIDAPANFDRLRAAQDDEVKVKRRKKIRRVAARGGAAGYPARRKIGGTTACVFGAPNADGCKSLAAR